MNTAQPKSWFGVLGSVVLGVTFAMTACGGDDGDDGDDGGGGGGSAGASNGGTSTAGAPAMNTTGGNASSVGGTSSSAGGIPSSGGVAGRQQFPNLRRNTAPSAN